VSDPALLIMSFRSDGRTYVCPKLHTQVGEFFITGSGADGLNDAYSGPMCRKCFVTGLGLMFRNVLAEPQPNEGDKAE
jgi:hypothetical protein